MPLLHLEDEEVGDLVTHLVETFRKGVNSFIEELDAKLRYEFEALERKEVQLRVERQALDEMRKCLRQEQDSLEACKHRCGTRKTQKQMKVRFNDEDEKQIVDPQIASDFLINAPEPEPSPGDESESREAGLFRRHSHLSSLHPSGDPKPSETVTIAGCQYAVLPSTSPEDETRPRLRGTQISIPSGWSLLSTSVDGFEYILQQLTMHCWGTPLIAIQSQKDPQLFDTFRTALSTSSRAGSRYRADSRHASHASVAPSQRRGAQDRPHLRLNHEFGRLVICKSINGSSTAVTETE